MIDVVRVYLIEMGMMKFEKCDKIEEDRRCFFVSDGYRESFLNFNGDLYVCDMDDLAGVSCFKVRESGKDVDVMFGCGCWEKCSWAIRTLLEICMEDKGYSGIRVYLVHPKGMSGGLIDRLNDKVSGAFPTEEGDALNTVGFYMNV